ncbi:MAG TPA: hypothetical protein VKB38_10885 [Terracidiphilus sp.]|nr:hypothetical protein [Terracidiphilus sp.]
MPERVEHPRPNHLLFCAILLIALFDLSVRQPESPRVLLLQARMVHMAALGWRRPYRAVQRLFGNLPAGFQNESYARGHRNSAPRRSRLAVGDEQHAELTSFPIQLFPAHPIALVWTKARISQDDGDLLEQFRSLVQIRRFLFGSDHPFPVMFARKERNDRGGLYHSPILRKPESTPQNAQGAIHRADLNIVRHAMRRKFRREFIRDLVQLGVRQRLVGEKGADSGPEPVPIIQHALFEGSPCPRFETIITKTLESWGFLLFTDSHQAVRQGCAVR